MKKTLTLLVISTLFINSHVAARPFHKAAKSEYTEQVDHIVSWFWNLVDVYDKIVDEEKKKQFLRKIDTLRKNIYKLENKSRDFLYSIPKKYPNKKERKLLQKKLKKLKSRLEYIVKSLTDIGADIRVIDKEYQPYLSTEESIYKAAATRGMAIEVMEISLGELLEESSYESLVKPLEDPPEWDSNKMKRLFSEAILSLNTAQHKITEFQMSLQ